MIVLIRRDKESAWDKHNPVLRKHEIVKVFPDDGSTPKFKIGDGVTSYSDLSFVDKFVFDANTPFITGTKRGCFEVRFDVNLDGSLPYEEE